MHFLVKAENGGLFTFLFCFFSLLSPHSKYAKYMENHSVEAVQNVYKRACMMHLPKKPTVHLLWAAFEEQQGKSEYGSLAATDFTVQTGFLCF